MEERVIVKINNKSISQQSLSYIKHHVACSDDIILMPPLLKAGSINFVFPHEVLAAEGLTIGINILHNMMYEGDTTCTN
jgi:hypothetical protein